MDAMLWTTGDITVLTRYACPRYYHVHSPSSAESQNCDLCGGTGIVEEWQSLRKLVADIVNVTPA